MPLEEKEITSPEVIDVNSRPVNGYTQILRRISAFGGVQIFSVLINIVRGKFVAVLLGPEGMGISSMLTASTGTVQQFAGLGLNLAMVKEVAAGKDHKEHIPVILSIAVRLIFLTALLGSIVCLFLAPMLSLWSFGNYDYSVGFALLSAGVGLGVGGAGYLSLLQGLGEVKRLSWASVVGGLAGLLFGVPLYYFWGLDGIVPSLLIFSLSVFLFYFISFRRAVRYNRLKVDWKMGRPLVKKLISLGIVLMIGSLAGTLTNYLINIFIRALGSLDDVGLFQAANSLTNQYAGVVFSALALDYFPRLSAVAREKNEMRKVVNRQMEIVVLIVTPIVLLLLLTAPVLIRLLLSGEFLCVTPLMRWLGFGVLLQAVTFPMGYIFIACDKKKVYVWMEVVMVNVLWIACSLFFYYFYGLIGLGISLVVRTLIDIVVSYVVCKKYYGFRIERRTLFVILLSLMLGAGGFLVSLSSGLGARVSLAAIFAISGLYSLLALRKGVKTYDS